MGRRRAVRWSRRRPHRLRRERGYFCEATNSTELWPSPRRPRAHSTGDLAARAHLVAGRSAHLADRWQIGRSNTPIRAARAELARTLARRALWLRFLAGLGAGELPICSDRLDDFKRSARLGRPAVADGSPAGTCRWRNWKGDSSRRSTMRRCALVAGGEAVDPIAHTGLLSVYSYALILTCRYEESLKQQRRRSPRRRELAASSSRCPMRSSTRAKAFIGLRRFAPAASSTLDARASDARASRAATFVAIFRFSALVCTRASATSSERSTSCHWVPSSAQPRRCAASISAGKRSSTPPCRRRPTGASARCRCARVEPSTGAEGCSRIVAEAIVALGAERRTMRRLARLRHVIDSWDLGPGRDRAYAQRRTSVPSLRSSLNGAAGSSDCFVLLETPRSPPRLGLRIPRAAKPRPAELTPRESEVHELLAQGLTNEEIAKLLYISLSTTKVHVKHIYEKLGVRSRLEAARALRDDV